MIKTQIENQFLKKCKTKNIPTLRAGENLVVINIILSFELYLHYQKKKV